jgi:hypothetical protein
MECTYQRTDIDYHTAKYRRHYARCIGKLRVIGATRAEVAKFFGVDLRTLDEWARRHKDFDWALQTDPTALGVTSEDLVVLRPVRPASALQWCGDVGCLVQSALLHRPKRRHAEDVLCAKPTTAAQPAPRPHMLRSRRTRSASHCRPAPTLVLTSPSLLGRAAVRACLQPDTASALRGVALAL